MVKIYTYKIETNSNYLNKITQQVNEAIEQSNISNGIVTVEAVASSTGILLIKDDENVLADVLLESRRLVPARINYKYQQSPEVAAGNIKASLFGSSVSMIVENKQLINSDNKDVYLADYDCPNVREFKVCVMGE